MAHLVSLNGRPLQSVKGGWTNKHLFDFFQEYEKARTSLLGMLIKNRLVDWCTVNQEAYLRLDAELLKLQQSYFEMENGTIKIAQVDGRASFVLLDGKELAEYQKELSAVLGRRATIIFPKHASW